MKKSISFLIALGILLSMCTFSASASDNGSYAVKKELLEKLSIISEDSSDSTVIKRGYLAEVAVRAMGLSDFVPNGVYTEFSDVGKDNPYSSYIYMARQLKLISGYGDNTYRPDDTVTINDAATVFMNILGYGARAMLSGGYPSGYLREINQTGILKGVSKELSDELDLKNLVIMVYNGLNTETLKTKKVGKKDSVEFYSDERETLLFDSFDIKKEKGIIKGVDITSLAGENDLPPYSVCINDKIFYAGSISVYEMLGCEVTAYYKYSSGRDRIVYIENNLAKNNSDTVKIGDIIKISDYRVYYDNNGKTGSFSYEKDAFVVYNGVNTSAKFNIDLLKNPDKTMKEGEIKLLDNDNDNKAEIIFVDAYKNFKIGKADSVAGIAHDEYDFKNSVNINQKSDDPFVLVYNEEGEKISGNTISDGVCVTVYESLEDAPQKYINIYVSRKTINGYLSGTAFDDDNNKLLIIDDISYPVTAYFEKNNADVTVGRNVILYLNHKGEAVDIKYAPSELTWGMIAKVKYKSKIEDELLIKILLDNGSLVTYKVADKVKIDGNMKRIPADYKEIERTLGAAADAVAPGRRDDSYYQIIKFRTDGSGKINYIDTVLDENGIKMKKEDSSGENQVYFGTVSGKYFASVNTIGNKVILDRNYIIYTYPGKTLADSDEYYKIEKTTIKNDTKQNLSFFSDDKESMSAGIFIKEYSKTDMSGEATIFSTSIVKSISTVAGDDGETKLKLTLFTDGEEYDILADTDLTSSDSLDYPISSLKEDDLIYYNKSDIDGGIDSFVVGYLKEKDEIHLNNVKLNNYYYKCYIYRAGKNGIQLVQTEDKSLIKTLYESGEYITIDNDRIKIYVVDSREAKNKRIKKGTYSDLIGFEEDKDNCSPIILRRYSSVDEVCREIIVYK